METRAPRELPPPPRSVPLTTRLRILAGFWGAQLGWLLLGVFGVPVTWFILANADVQALTFFRDELERSTFEQFDGVVTEVTDTGLSQGGGKRSKGTPIFAYRYSFKGPDGQTVNGVSYAPDRKLEAGVHVVVERSRSNPSLYRIQHMLCAPFGPDALIVGILPIAGLTIVALTLRGGLRGVRLLEHGELAFATLRSREPTNITVKVGGNSRAVEKLTFSFVASDGRSYDVVTKTHETERLTDEEREPVLYDSLAPANAVLLDGLPGAPGVDEQGQITRTTGKELRAFVLPGIAIVGHAVGLVARIVSP